MRHRKRGRHLGRTSSHRVALLRNLASALLLTEVDDDLADNKPKIKGRIVTTLEKAKEVRPLVERCITIARRSLSASEISAKLEPTAKKGTDAWKSWRNGPGWREWCAARAPVVTAKRRVMQLLGNSTAMAILFDVVAPRMKDRDGGYTRVLRLAKPRLGDAGTTAILELVGKSDRVKQTSTIRPTMDNENAAGE
jgi:large subunit ribosomal protein L17